MAENVGINKTMRHWWTMPIVTPRENYGRNIRTFTDLAEKYNSLTRYALERYESSNKIGLKHNVLIKYLWAIYDNPDYITNYRLNIYLANECEFKSKSLAKVLYGDTEMYWIILMLNDISHESELSKDMLMNKGVMVLNGNGLTYLTKLLNFKMRKEVQNSIDIFTQKEF